MPESKKALKFFKENRMMVSKDTGKLRKGDLLVIPTDRGPQDLEASGTWIVFRLTRQEETGFLRVRLKWVIEQAEAGVLYFPGRSAFCNEWVRQMSKKLCLKG